MLHLERLSRQITKSDLLKFLHSVGGLESRRVGRIELRAGEALIEVPGDWQARLVKALDGQTLGHHRVRAWADGPSDDEDGGGHFERLARLLDLESRAEAQEAAERGRRLSATDAERTGTSLVGLVIIDDQTGLGGRYLLQLAKRRRAPLPWTRLDVGSPIVLWPDGGKDTAGHRGVVCERAEGSIRVALGNASDDLAEQEIWRLDLADDEIAGQRQRAALQRARLARAERLAELRDVLLGRRAAQFDRERDEPALAPGLNEAQQQAVRFALAARDVALIHGPPGTGKTTAVVELIRRAVRRGEKVLACAPSNLAVDNIFERLLGAGERAVRLGHPARVLADLRTHTLDLLVEEHPDVRLARKLVKEAMGLFRQAGRYTRAAPPPGARRQTREEARSLLADARHLEAQAIEHILDTADVLCATTTALDSDLLGRWRFDLGVSLFERLMTRDGRSLARPLTVQYRMHEAIMDFSSREFYEAGLQADPSVARHVLADLPGVAATTATQAPVEFIDTAGASFDEEVEPDGESRLNRQEAVLVVRKVRELLSSGVPPGDIAVIAPYAAQVRLLREQISVPGLEIDSVDGFQGREKEAVAISLVRSNSQGEIGFLQDIRRMNVALTRARRKLLVVGDSATLSGHAFYRRMIAYFEAVGAYHTVWEQNSA